MQINSVNGYLSSNQNFTGEIVNNYALRKLMSGLHVADIDTFQKYVCDIERVKDNKKFIYLPVISGNCKLAKIYKLDENGKAINPPMFADNGNPLNVFKKLADFYKNVQNKV